ncbi:RES domain [Legionella wadsworthii]|uniref:RES domain n=1 Tax=Legionella wadsworthii TaxID=28088 RepID=A0A378LR00_9GAMM|nr:RES family NAD+ phosphorylase [Legionella wadsworthii]STY28268.1 RES domain [Legionella wadsworthii]
MNLWKLCQGCQFIKPLAAEPWRVVEAQHVLSARDLVDSREEHELLEELIESSKPKIEKTKNYLIFTPFRYPPLAYGSRFGKTYEPSLWYGSFDLDTSFTEVAYYRLKFFSDTDADLGYVELSMTAFTAAIECKSGVDLTEDPFNQYTKEISHKDTYEYSQALGSNMREEGVESFVYFSARTPEKKKNIAAFTPSVFQLKRNQYVHNQQNWKCITNKDLVEFTRIGILGKKELSFSKNLLM